MRLGKEFKKLFSKDKLDKILTAETSGIAITVIVAQYFIVPMGFC